MVDQISSNIFQLMIIHSSAATSPYAGLGAYSAAGTCSAIASVAAGWGCACFGSYF
jgi:hypothetical protein